MSSTNRPFSFFSRPEFESFVVSHARSMIADKKFLLLGDDASWENAQKDLDIGELKKAARMVCSRYEFTNMAFIGFMGTDMAQIVQETYHMYISATEKYSQ